MTGRLQGFAYVEMKSLESVPVVLQLNDRVPDFQKFPVMVKASEAEKNYLAKQVLYSKVDLLISTWGVSYFSLLGVFPPT